MSILLGKYHPIVFSALVSYTPLLMTLHFLLINCVIKETRKLFKYVKSLKFKIITKYWKILDCSMLVWSFKVIYLFIHSLLSKTWRHNILMIFLISKRSLLNNVTSPPCKLQVYVTIQFSLLNVFHRTHHYLNILLSK